MSTTDDRRIRLYLDRQLLADDLTYDDITPIKGPPPQVGYQGKTYGINGSDRENRGKTLILHCFGPL